MQHYNNDILSYIKLYLKNGISFFPLFPRTKTPVVKHADYYSRMPTREELKEWLKTYLNPSFWKAVWDSKEGDKLWSLKQRWLEALNNEFSKIGKSVDDYEYSNEINIAVCGGFNGLVLIDIEDASKITSDPLRFFSNLDFTVVKTGKEHGYHLYAVCKDWKENVKGDNGEIRCFNQYVVAPPSVHPNGHQYMFLTPFKLEEISSSFIKNTVFEWIQAKKPESGKEEKKEFSFLWNEIKEGAKKLPVVHGKRSDWTFALTLTAKAYLKDEKTAFEELLEIPICRSKITRDGDWDLDRAFDWWKKYEWDSVDKVSKLSPLYALSWAEKTTNMSLHVDYKQLISDYLKITSEKGYGHLLSEAEIVLELVDIMNSCIEVVETKNGKERTAVAQDYLHRIADGINNMFFLASIAETDELLIFNNGIYKPCEAWLEKIIQLAWDYSELRNLKPISNQKVNEIISALKRKNYVPLSKFYENKNYINVKNGLLNMETWKLEPHRPEVYFLTQLNAEWDENANCEVWEEFLKKVTNNAEVLQEFAGYCLLQDCCFEKALAIVGPGGSGKSTFLEVLRTVLGFDNTTGFSIQQLENEKFAKSELIGKLANIYNDLPYNYLEKSDVFKQLVSGDPVQVEKKYKQPFLARLHVKLIFSANQLPRTVDFTDAFFRRWIIVTFPSKIENPDPALKRKLREDQEVRKAVLKWMVEGLKRLLENGFSYKLTADEIAEYYVSASDSVATFVSEHIEEDAGSRVWHSDLYEKYVEFCKKRHYPPVSTQQFSIRLKQLTRAVPKTKSGRRYWVGIKYVESKEEELEENGSKGYFNAEEILIDFLERSNED